MSASGSSTITRFCFRQHVGAGAQRVDDVRRLHVESAAGDRSCRARRSSTWRCTRLATSTAAVHALTKLPASSGLPLVKLALPLPPVWTTKTPIVIPSLAIRSPICCCSSTGRPIMPLSSKAVKPLSAMKRSCSSGSFPAEFANMPMCGAYFSLNAFFLLHAGRGGGGPAGRGGRRAAASGRRRRIAWPRRRVHPPPLRGSVVCSWRANHRPGARRRAAPDARRRRFDPRTL